ncbi:restriction endonuclease [Paenibacillus sp. JZ16]|uniref:restriction endonuclease n=1 Tax=Paenibacillus sp. JZ16 TaxID=1906272 RepID=UPI00188AB263|nr:restriction endonuclease [Paenibacillus sp. JZ16]
MAISVSRKEVITRTGELIGYKSGLGLNKEEFDDIIPTEYHQIWFGPAEGYLRLYPEEFEGLIEELLQRLGNIESTSPGLFTLHLRHKYRHNAKKTKLLDDVFPFFLKMMENFNTAAQQGEDPNKAMVPPLIEATLKYGKEGSDLIMELVDGLNGLLHKSPWTSIRETEWKDVAKLNDLFVSENLKTQHGTFMDQRYIDYLRANFDDKIGSIHWRKFEGLTAEFFERQGYFVEIGPGRADGGIDVRVWTEDPKLAGPPTILIQCKRQKSVIEQTIVKALYADVLHEQAQKGLIVTSSSFSPGSKTLCLTREYPVAEANRETLRSWVKAMRKPGTGIWAL